MSIDKSNWLSRVKSLQEEIEYLYTWENPESINIEYSNNN